MVGKIWIYSRICGCHKICLECVSSRVQISCLQTLCFSINYNVKPIIASQECVLIIVWYVCMFVFMTLFPQVPSLTLQATRRQSTARHFQLLEAKLSTRLPGMWGQALAPVWIIMRYQQYAKADRQPEGKGEEEWKFNLRGAYHDFFMGRANPHWASVFRKKLTCRCKIVTTSWGWHMWCRGVSWACQSAALRS